MTQGVGIHYGEIASYTKRIYVMTADGQMIVRAKSSAIVSTQFSIKGCATQRNTLINV